MVEVCAVFCHCLLWLDRGNICMYMAHVGFYVCCSGLCGSMGIFVVERC